MRDTSPDLKLPEDLQISDIISLKDPFRLLHKAESHWSPLVRFASLIKLEQHVPSSSEFAKSPLMPTLFNFVDRPAGGRNHLVFEVRRAAEMLAKLLRHVGVPEEEELNAGNRIIRAFGESKDIRTKVALVVAAEKLGSVTTEMTEFLANCKSSAFNKFRSEVGELLVTRCGKAAKGVSLMNEAMRDGADRSIGQAFSLAPNKSDFWALLEASNSYSEVSTSIAILEPLCFGDERKRLVETLYKRATDMETSWDTAHQVCALGFIRTLSRPIDERTKVQLNHVFRFIFTKPIEILHDQRRSQDIDACAGFADFACPIIFELASESRLSEGNHGFVRALFAASPVEALIAHHEALEKLRTEEVELQERVSGYGVELNKATIDSLHKKRDLVEGVWRRVKGAVDQALDELRNSSPEYRQKYAKYLESVRGIEHPNRHSPIE